MAKKAKWRDILKPQTERERDRVFLCMWKKDRGREKDIVTERERETEKKKAFVYERERERERLSERVFA